MYNSAQNLRNVWIHRLSVHFQAPPRQGNRSCNQGTGEEMINEGKARTHSFRSMQIWALFIVVGAEVLLKKDWPWSQKWEARHIHLCLTLGWPTVHVCTWKIIFSVTDIQIHGFFFGTFPFSPHWLLIGNFNWVLLGTVRIFGGVGKSDWGQEVWP